MRGAVLPAALLCLAFVFMLAFAPGRARVPALVTAVGALIAGLLMPSSGLALCNGREITGARSGRARVPEPHFATVADLL